MKKGYYIYYGSSSSGVLKKIDMQIAEFSKYASVSKIMITQKDKNFIKKIISCWPSAEIGLKYDDAIKKITDPDFIYMRRMTADSGYVAFINTIKKKYPKCKIILEIPTYPYFRDSYAQNFSHFVRTCPYYLKDLIYTKQLKGLVDKVVTFSEDKEIYGIPTIRTGNGVDVNSISLSTSKYNRAQLNIISVAMYANHHGYERVIKSIYRYYKNGGSRNIVYYCIGFGKELNKYKMLVNLYKLDKHVFFLGEKDGIELDEYYNIAHIGLDFFGGYKENLDFISSLKTVEYLSRGIPVATGINVNVFTNKPCDYYIQFANNSSDINLEDLFRFYDRVYSKNNLHHEIRSYAKKNVDSAVVLQDIVNFINK